MIRVYLLDIEGTTTPIDFVSGVLFPYARARLAAFLSRPLDQIGDVLKALDRERQDDTAWTGGDDAHAYLEFLMDHDRKSPALKEIQGRIWQEGYASGELTGQVYDDVVPAIQRWRRDGARVFIYSSGSVLAQRLLFGHLPPDLFEGHFDTAIGAKKDAASYVRIAEAIGERPGDILFLSDASAEVDAARAAGLQTRLVDRTGRTSGAVLDFDAV